MGRPVLVHVAGLASRCRDGGRPAGVLLGHRPVAHPACRGRPPRRAAARSGFATTARARCATSSCRSRRRTARSRCRGARAGRASPARSGDLEAGRELVLGADTFTRPGKDARHRLGVLCGRRRRRPERRHRRALAGRVPLRPAGDVGQDRLVGTSRGEWICARPGWDSIDGRGGNDRIEAGRERHRCGRNRTRSDRCRRRCGRSGSATASATSSTAAPRRMSYSQTSGTCCATASASTAADRGGARSSPGKTRCAVDSRGSSGVAAVAATLAGAQAESAATQASSCTPPLVSSAHTAGSSGRCGRTTTSGNALLSAPDGPSATRPRVGCRRSSTRALPASAR